MLVVGVMGVGLVVLSDAESLTWSGQAPFGLLLAGVAALAGSAGAATQQAMGENNNTSPGETSLLTNDCALDEVPAWIKAIDVSGG